MLASGGHWLYLSCFLQASKGPWDSLHLSRIQAAAPEMEDEAACRALALEHWAVPSGKASRGHAHGLFGVMMDVQGCCVQLYPLPPSLCVHGSAHFTESSSTSLDFLSSVCFSDFTFLPLYLRLLFCFSLPLVLQH